MNNEQHHNKTQNSIIRMLSLPNLLAPEYQPWFSKSNRWSVMLKTRGKTNGPGDKWKKQRFFTFLFGVGQSLLFSFIIQLVIVLAVLDRFIETGCGIRRSSLFLRDDVPKHLSTFHRFWGTILQFPFVLFGSLCKKYPLPLRRMEAWWGCGFAYPPLLYHLLFTEFLPFILTIHFKRNNKGRLCKSLWPNG